MREREQEAREREGREPTAPVNGDTADANAIVPVPPAMTPEELDVRGDAVEAVRNEDEAARERDARERRRLDERL